MGARAGAPARAARLQVRTLAGAVEGGTSPRRAGPRAEEAPMGKQRRRLSEQERAQRRREDRERLERAVSELLTSEGWKRWLRARSVLHGYSLII